MTRTVLIIAAAGLFLAQSGEPGPEGMLKELWKKRTVYEDGSIYAGALRDGKKQGPGIFVWPDGSEYRGEFRDGEADGEGLYLYADGRRKRVTYERGVMKKASLISNAVRIDGAEFGEFNSNGRYSGWFRGNKVKGYVPHGRGTMRYLNGSVYTGQWDNGRMHGNGKIVWDDGAVYAGQWEHGKRSGFGSYTWASGDRYVGQWKENQLFGRGTMYHSDGRVERGVWPERTVRWDE